MLATALSFVTGVRTTPPLKVRAKLTSPLARFALFRPCVLCACGVLATSTGAVERENQVVRRWLKTLQHTHRDGVYPWWENMQSYADGRNNTLARAIQMTPLALVELLSERAFTVYCPFGCV